MGEKPSDGGPAFARPAAYSSGGATSTEHQVGMTLRDYFAARAITGAMGSVWASDADMPEIARRSYLLADAMLKARSS